MEMILIFGVVLIVVVLVARWASSGQSVQSRRSSFGDDDVRHFGGVRHYHDDGSPVVDVVTGIATGIAIDAAVGAVYDGLSSIDPTDISDAPSNDFGSYDSGSYDSGSSDSGGSDGGGGGGD